MAGPALTTSRIGTAGWALPKALRLNQSANKSVLEHYADRFNAVEINSSFYRPHRRSTYERWSASVPDSFRFSVKLPRVITHELGLVGCQSETVSFVQSASGLAHKFAVLLVQLPPSRKFDESAAAAFFKVLREETSANIVCEARNSSWFISEATAVFEAYGVTRVAADPVPLGCELAPRPDSRFAYYRLHGSPRAMLQRLVSATVAPPRPPSAVRSPRPPLRPAHPQGCLANRSCPRDRHTHISGRRLC